MKPREKRGVVDSKLNVYGVRGLKVAGRSSLALGRLGSLLNVVNRLVDMSICPSNVGAVSNSIF